MRAFIILGFLVAAISADRLDNLGYNYGPGVSGTIVGSGSSLVGSGSSLVGSGSSLVGTVGVPTQTLVTTGPRYGSSLIGTGSRLINSGLGGGLISTGGYGGRVIGSGGLISSGGLIGTGGSGLINSGRVISGGGGLINTGSVLLGANALDSVPQTVEYRKQFFDFTAPEETHEEGHITRQLTNVLKKNLQVVFIKAPENNAATNAALQLAKQAIEQRTAIYVLSKQNDGAQLVGQLQQIQESVPTQPEVRIIKYRTPEDLAIAKETIRSQYEATGGSSENYDGGVAPVLNYASGVGSVSSGGVLLGSGYGSSIGGGSLIGSGLGSTQIISGGSNLGSTHIIGGSSLGSGLGTTIIKSGSIGGAGYLPPLKKK